ncbi:McrC family protein [Flavobacterium sp. HJSW_4]|uniref:McrC family protein n=1 Tax=Flavobacterium sp. HJSW_4 TaxID=3344660 RepID=UPI0035F4810F
MNKQQITIFEHDSLIVGQKYSGIIFKSSHLESLETFFGDGNYSHSSFLDLTKISKIKNQLESFPFYSLIKNGVRFCQFVGILQLNNLIIEVLPKADKNWNINFEKKGISEKAVWRNLLIKMLYTINSFDINITSFSSLKIIPNNFLDIYYELFISEIESLLYKGLINKYRDKEENRKSLNGNLIFSKNIQYNLIHKERFYVQTTGYDKEHQLHRILYKALKLLQQINTSQLLKSRINRLVTSFPEMKDFPVQENTFNKIVLNRKSQQYKTALNIAKMILLNFHPDISKGKDEVLALMFDMNNLWEKFIFNSIKSNPLFKVEEQKTADFWHINDQRKSYFKADIFITYENKNFVIDTKWKNLAHNIPSNEDLRQMFAYHHYYNASKTALLYPDNNKNITTGNYYKRTHDLKDEECSIIKVSVNTDIKLWQKEINDCIEHWIK